MKILQISVLSILGWMVLGGCDSGVDGIANDSEIKPHQIRNVSENYQRVDDNNYAELHVSSDKDNYGFVHYAVRNSTIKAHKQVYIDLDRSGESGYTPYEKEGIGAEYLLEDDHLFKYTGNGGFDWSWEYIKDFNNPDKFSTVIPLSYLNNDESFNVQAVILDDNWDERFSSNVERYTKVVDQHANEKSFGIFSITTLVAMDELNTYFTLVDESEGKKYTHIQYFIDADDDRSTGYEDGYDYLVEDKTVFKFTGTNNTNEWSWEIIDTISKVDNTLIVPKDLTIDWSKRALRFYGVGLDKDWNEEVRARVGLYLIDTPDNGNSLENSEKDEILKEKLNHGPVSVIKTVYSEDGKKVALVKTFNYERGLFIYNFNDLQNPEFEERLPYQDALYEDIKFKNENLIEFKMIMIEHKKTENKYNIPLGIEYNIVYDISEKREVERTLLEL